MNSSVKTPLFTLKKKHKTYLIMLLIWLIFLQGIFLLNTIRDKNIHIYFLDVGQGDCIVITDTSHCFIIDGGGIRSDKDKENTGLQVLYPFLLEKRIKTVDAVFITHMHYDHIKGILELLTVMKVKEIILPSTYYDYSMESDIKDFIETLFQGGDEGQLYTELVDICEKQQIPINFMSYGNIIRTKQLDISCIYPTLETMTDKNENNNSLVLELETQGFKALFTGDIEAAEEEKVLQYWNGFKDINVLKVAHHGSKSSSMGEFIQSLNLDCAIISVGDNLFGHPHETVLARCEEMNIPVFTTRKYGMIEIVVEKEGYIIIPFKGDLK